MQRSYADEDQGNRPDCSLSSLPAGFSSVLSNLPPYILWGHVGSRFFTCTCPSIIQRNLRFQPPLYVQLSMDLNRHWHLPSSSDDSTLRRLHCLPWEDPDTGLQDDPEGEVRM